MKEKLTIQKVESKVSKLGRPFKSITTSIGTMSCFEDPVVRDLEANVGKEIEVEWQLRGNFKNLTRVYLPEAVKAEKLAATNEEMLALLREIKAILLK